MRRRLPNLLATRNGRFAAFFLLYVTEGIPQGFTATAVAAQMRRQGVSAQEIGLFVGSLYLPWAWKWSVAPLVDLVSVRRFGARRFWILLCQLAMIATLLLSMSVDFATQLQMFTSIILIHNCFGATQDVAIDALACDVLSEHERGMANGVMFSGAFSTEAGLGGVIGAMLARCSRPGLSVRCVQAGAGQVQFFAIKGTVRDGSVERSAAGTLQLFV